MLHLITLISAFHSCCSLRFYCEQLKTWITNTCNESWWFILIVSHKIWFKALFDSALCYEVLLCVIFCYGAIHHIISFAKKLFKISLRGCRIERLKIFLCSFISLDFTLCHIHLGPGIRYFTTIIACNTADLCTSVTSDGVIVDNSPPTKGVVIDGVDIFDLEYQSLRFVNVLICLHFTISLFSRTIHIHFFSWD